MTKRHAPYQDDHYSIPAAGFRLLVGEIHDLLADYYTAAKRLAEIKNEAQLLRVQKKYAGYEKRLVRHFRALGLPADSGAACDVLAEAIWKRYDMTFLPADGETEKPDDPAEDDGDMFFLFNETDFGESADE